MLQGVNLYLIGMMGVGKSTVGRLLAAELRYRFLDLDHLIEGVSGRSVAQLFAEVGEVAFRQLETEVLARVAPYTRTVVATGGGVVTESRNWGYLHSGVIVWLDAEVEVLVRRVEAASQKETRPLLAGSDPHERLSQILEQRRPRYAQADVRVETGEASPEQVARLALEGLRVRLAEDAIVR